MFKGACSAPYLHGAEPRGVDLIRDEPYLIEISLILERSPVSSASK